MEEKYLHKPVLLEEVLEFLDLSAGKTIVDATVGGGGHSRHILERISPGGTLIGIDRDPESLKIAHERLKDFSDSSFKLVNRNFVFLKEIFSDLNIGEADGILFDLGISSVQMETAQRGFSIKNNGPLDMRMNRSRALTAKDIVNRMSERDLSDLIQKYGEERFHRRIAGNIARSRKRKEIETTGELASIISAGIPYKNRRGRIHPATRTFQAIRIAVNDELKAVEEAVKKASGLLTKNGRLCVIAFHSLEDRIVKNIMKSLKRSGDFRIHTKKPVTAGSRETDINPRSRSAKLRVAERII